MGSANLLLAVRFDGAGYPTFAPWPDIDFPAAAGVNLAGWGRPVVDGTGWGIPSRSIGNVTWRGLCSKSPGTTLYRADLTCRWQNAGFAARREVGLIVRAKDVLNCFVARVRSMGTASPELRLFQISAGVETQRGATYTGAGLSATVMNAALTWAVRTENLASGDIKVTVYLSPSGGASKGTQVLEWTGDPGLCGGAFGIGVELRDLVSFDDVRVDDLEAYDTADEYAPSPAPGTGWTVRLGGTLYTMDGLAGLSPRAKLLRVKQAFGLKGNSAHLAVDADYRIGTLVKPGTEVVCYHDGDVRFRGWIEDGACDTSPEQQVWNCYDGYFAARNVQLREDNGVPGLKFNVTDEQSEDFKPARKGMTLGAILKFLFDRYLSRLRFYGAAPPDALPYDAAELAAITAVVPDVYVTGTFAAAIETLLRYVGHKYMVWWNPASQVWQFRNTTATSAASIECTADWVQFKINPDRTRAYTAVEWIGAAPAALPYLDLSVKDGGLKPVWTAQQENKYGPEKRSKSILDVFIIGRGSGVAPDGFTRDYVDVDAGLLDEDDIRGWVTSVVGYRRLVTNNTSTRIWLSDPRWAAPPANGTHLTFDATDPDALAELSAQGVGRGYYFVGQIVETGMACSSPFGPGAGMQQQGFCGEAFTQQVGADGKFTYGEQLAYKVKYPNAFQQAAGFCNPVLTLSEKPKPYWFGPFLIQPKGSVPQGYCDQATTPDAKPATIDLAVRVPVAGDAPRLREPPAEDTFEGTAFEQWDARQVYTVNDPDYVSSDQEAGLRLAAADVLSVKKDKPFLLSVQRAANWSTVTPQKPTLAATSSFAGLTKRLQITSALRPTGFEVLEKLIVFSVTWDVQQSLEVIECGSTAGWLEASGIDIAKGISEARILKRALTEVKRLEDFRNAMLNKAADRVGGQLKGAIQACQIPVSDTQSLDVNNVQQHDQKKVGQLTQAAARGVLDASLMMGVEAQFPGNPIAIPGRDGAAAQQVVDGAVLRPLGDALIPFQGPVPGPGGSLGYYGGPIVTDAKLSGDPPDIVRRMGGLVWRKRAAADGNRKGGPGLEWSLTDSAGNATGGWSVYAKPSDLPGGVVPLKILSAGSIGDQLLKKSQELARALGRVEDSLGRLQAPGTVSAKYPDGAPADLATSLRASGLLGAFDFVPESFEDPGGAVWAGPRSPDGADAGLYWRVKTPELILVRVTPVAFGGGMNGGAWALDVSGPGGSTEFLSRGSIVHKQLHYADMSPDATQPGIVAASPAQNAFGFTLEGYALNAVAPNAASGVGGVLAMPQGVRGTPMFSAVLEEDAVRGAVPANGKSYMCRLDWQYKASAWGVAGGGAGTPTPVPMADGAATGSGVYKQPGGAVPPGLRAIGVSSVYIPSAAPGFAGLAKSVTVIGIGVDLAVVEGGYALLYKEGLSAAESWRNSMPVMIEVASFLDVWSLTFTKGLAEGLALGETWSSALNPPLEIFERLSLADVWHLELNGVPVF